MLTWRSFISMDSYRIQQTGTGQIWLLTEREFEEWISAARRAAEIH
jgi:hypothetical protein